MIKKWSCIMFIWIIVEKIKYLKTNNKIKTQPYGMEIQP